MRQYESWRAKVIADEKRSQQAYEHVPLLWPSGPISRQAMISVFGGTAPGVKALLATLGSSLLGMQQVTIINLADSHAADPLIQLAELCGMPAQVDAIS
ncbi:MAG TPA: hypothetical protein VK162_22915, partial [Streptosporangiaceae bacterium]|nr:hypothetical protein [Streptosporangiaceae bacterium]